MTVIAAMDCDDHLLMGADTLATEELGTRANTSKLCVLPDRPVVFSFAGSVDIGFGFRDWVNAYEWPECPTWARFTDLAIYEPQCRICCSVCWIGRGSTWSSSATAQVGSTSNPFPCPRCNL